jgi:DNA processing protein
VNELALAAFAAARDAHAVDAEAATDRFARFEAAFDAPAFTTALAAAGYRWLARSDPAFPPLLRAIHDPPPGLFVRGESDLELLQRPAVAIVGARSCTDYGAHVARALAREVAGAGVVVISGLARGVDGWAHRGSLESGCATVAVLGCGIDRDYPHAHAALAAQIAQSGLIVSEYPPGVVPAPWRFPARNRIVSGLAAATVVVEARERSGALITADLALEQGRDVLAVPGEITSALSRGANALLRLGAVPVTSARDILEVLGLDAPSGGPQHPPGGAAAAALAALDAGAATADEIARGSGLAPAAAAAALAELELAGFVETRAGVYRR